MIVQLQVIVDGGGNEGVDAGNVVDALTKLREGIAIAVDEVGKLHALPLRAVDVVAVVATEDKPLLRAIQAEITLRSTPTKCGVS